MKKVIPTVAVLTLILGMSVSAFADQADDDLTPVGVVIFGGKG